MQKRRLRNTHLFVFGGQHEVGRALVGRDDAQGVVRDGRVVRVRLRVARSVHLLDLRVSQMNLRVEIGMAFRKGRRNKD